MPDGARGDDEGDDVVAEQRSKLLVSKKTGEPLVVYVPQIQKRDILIQTVRDLGGSPHTKSAKSAKYALVEPKSDDLHKIYYEILGANPNCIIVDQKWLFSCATKVLFLSRKPYTVDKPKKKVAYKNTKSNWTEEEDLFMAKYLYRENRHQKGAMSIKTYNEMCRKYPMFDHPPESCKQRYKTNKAKIDALVQKYEKQVRRREKRDEELYSGAEGGEVEEEAPVARQAKAKGKGRQKEEEEQEKSAEEAEEAGFTSEGEGEQDVFRSKKSKPGLSSKNHTLQQSTSAAPTKQSRGISEPGHSTSKAAANQSAQLPEEESEEEHQQQSDDEEAEDAQEEIVRANKTKASSSSRNNTPKQRPVTKPSSGSRKPQQSTSRATNNRSAQPVVEQSDTDTEKLGNTPPRESFSAPLPPPPPSRGTSTAPANNSSDRPRIATIRQQDASATETETESEKDELDSDPTAVDPIFSEAEGGEANKMAAEKQTINKKRKRSSESAPADELPRLPKHPRYQEQQPLALGNQSSAITSRKTITSRTQKRNLFVSETPEPEAPAERRSRSTVSAENAEEVGTAKSVRLPVELEVEAGEMEYQENQRVSVQPEPHAGELWADHDRKVSQTPEEADADGMGVERDSRASVQLQPELRQYQVPETPPAPQARFVGPPPAVLRSPETTPEAPVLAPARRVLTFFSKPSAPFSSKPLPPALLNADNDDWHGYHLDTLFTKQQFDDLVYVTNGNIEAAVELTQILTVEQYEKLGSEQRLRFKELRGLMWGPDEDAALLEKVQESEDIARLSADLLRRRGVKRLKERRSYLVTYAKRYGLSAVVRRRFPFDG